MSILKNLKDNVKIGEQGIASLKRKTSRRAPAIQMHTKMTKALAPMLLINSLTAQVKEMTDQAPILQHQVAIGPEPLRRDLRITRRSMRNIDQNICGRPVPAGW